MSHSEDYYTYDVSLVGEDFMKLEDTQYLFFPKSNQKIPVLVKTTNVEPGFYEPEFSFCPLDLGKNATFAITYCQTVKIYVNVSENCAELPPIVADEPKLFGLIEVGTAKLVFNVAALFLILILFVLLVGKRVMKTKHKK